MFRDIEMDDLAATMFDDEKAVQDSKGDSWHSKEIHGRDDLTVIVKECGPALAGINRRRQTPEISRDGSFRDLEIEFQKLTVNSWSTLRWILLYHSPNESSNLPIDRWPADLLGARSQPPEQSEARSMPGDNRLWFDNDQDVGPCRPKAAEQNPKHSILDSHPRARLCSLEHAQLLTEGKDLEAEVVAGTEECAEAVEEAQEKWNHELGFIAYRRTPASALNP
jgi:hypothetical protein